MLASPVESIETLYSVAHWLVEQERPTDAAIVFRTMLLAAPADERGWVGLALCHERQAEVAIALNLYTMARAAAAPACRTALAEARLLQRLDRPDEAYDAFVIAEEGALSRGLDDLAVQIAEERGAL